MLCAQQCTPGLHKREGIVVTLTDAARLVLCSWKSEEATSMPWNRAKNVLHRRKMNRGLVRARWDEWPAGVTRRVTVEVKISDFRVNIRGKVLPSHSPIWRPFMKYLQPRTVIFFLLYIRKTVPVLIKFLPLLLITHLTLVRWQHRRELVAGPRRTTLFQAGL